MKEITTQELEQKVKSGENVHVIDVRENEEVAQGKVPGADHIRLSELPDKLHEIDKEVHHYIICRSGGRSGRACEFLTASGYDVTNVQGGMLTWSDKVE